MSATTAIAGHATLARYYDILGAGIDAYADGRDLLPLLAEDFVFDGPIAGRMAGGARFVHGVRGFIEAARRITPLQAVVTPAGAAVLYDAELPGGVVRFSEFFEFDDDRIRELHIQYDPADYLAKGGH
ncbi:nuclear transport factor 2 family protein [Agromyces bauzanensis]